MQYTWELYYVAKEKSGYERIDTLSYTVGPRIVDNLKKSNGTEVSIESAKEAIISWGKKYLEDKLDPSFSSLSCEGRVDRYLALVTSEDIKVCLISKITALTEEYLWEPI